VSYSGFFRLPSLTKLAYMYSQIMQKNSLQCYKQGKEERIVNSVADRGQRIEHEVRRAIMWGSTPPGSIHISALLPNFKFRLEVGLSYR
jgi:hypothetical protein